MTPALKLQKLLARAPRPILRNFERWQRAVVKLDAAPRGGRLIVARKLGRNFGLSRSTVLNRFYLFRQQGLMALLDKRFSSACWKRRPVNLLPAAAIQHLKTLAARSRLSNQAVIREFLRRVAAGRVPGVTAQAPGLSNRNLCRHLGQRPNPARIVVCRALIEIRADKTWRLEKAWRIRP